MSGGRQWVRRLGLLLAAGLVVQVPALVGVGVSGASAATPSYTASLSIDGNCMANVVARWTNATLQSVDVQLNDRNTQSFVTEHSTVSGTSGSQTYSLPLKSLLLTGAVNPHAFNAVVDFYDSSGNLAQQIYTNSLNGPCYLGQVPL